jgi:hypothetical protein
MTNIVEQSCLAEGEYSLPKFPGSTSRTNHDWKVDVRAYEHVIRRWVERDGEGWVPPGENLADAHVGEVIWPTWPTNLAEEKETSCTPLAELEQHWNATTNRLRDTAKWMAAVLGAGARLGESVVPVEEHCLS